MRYVLIIIFGLLMAGCTFHIKGKELDIQGKPAEPAMKWTNDTYELEKIEFLKS